MKVNTLKTETVNLGLETPFSVIHITDTHFTLADERDCERKQSLSVSRTRCFVPDGETKLKEAEEHSQKTGFTIIHTGDLIDFVSEKNLDRAKKFIDENDVMFIAGNHEFSLFVGEAFEDEAYRSQSLSHVNSFFKDDIRFNSRILCGVNFVGIDNGYYHFQKWQFEKLKTEVKKGLPTVLFLHTPLYEKSLFDYSFKDSKGDCSYLVGVPDELLKKYTPERFIQQKPDDITLETVEYIKNQPNIKLILAGHQHFDFECDLTENLKQYVTGMTTVRQFNFV